MAIGKTKADEMVKRANLLSEAVAWFKAFDNPTKTMILDWIRNDQLREQGVDKFGNVIGYYSRATDSLTNGRKRFNTPYTLLDTGDFYRSMYVSVFLDSIVIDASSGSFIEMRKQEWYTNAILGLTNENFERLKEVVRTKYIDYAREVLQIN